MEHNSTNELPIDRAIRITKKMASRINEQDRKIADLMEFLDTLDFDGIEAEKIEGATIETITAQIDPNLY